MFFRKKKTERSSRPSRPKQDDFGLGIPGFGGPSNDENDDELEAELFRLTGQKAKEEDIDFQTGGDDEDFEAELARLMGKTTIKAAKPVSSISKREAMVNVKSASIDVDDEDDEIDENDPDLLNELSALTNDDEEIVQENEEEEEEEKEEVPEISQAELIKIRLNAYREAESKAKQNNESSRARRFNRGVKTLEKLLRKASAGEFVPYDEIPPEIASNLKPASTYEVPAPVATEPTGPTQIVEPDVSYQEHPQSPESEEQTQVPNRDRVIPDAVQETTDNTPTTAVEDEKPQVPEVASLVEPAKVDKVLELLIKRREQHKAHALTSKRAGDVQAALASVKVVKVCDRLIETRKKGLPVNPEEIPTAPVSPTTPRAPPKQAQKNTHIVAGPTAPLGEIFTVPKTVLEALEQRLAYYTKALKKAETSSNRNDARKLSDIVRIYENSIKLHKKGARVPYEKLPTPPGCPPIPISFQVS